MTRNILFPEHATPIDDYSDLKLSWINTLNQLNLAEGDNIHEAYLKYFLKTELSIPDLFRICELEAIHKAMFDTVWSWAGKFRKTEKNLGVAAYKIQTELAILCSDVIWWYKNPNKITMSLLEQSAKIHYRIVSIHPFENGNGRFSRFIADLFLHLHGFKYPNWPTDLKDNTLCRLEYIKTLKCADQGDLDQLVNFMKRYLNS